MHEPRPSASETLRKYPYSSIVIIPYTTRIAGIAGEKVIERTANIRLSSYSAMVTEAARMAYRQGLAPHIIALGENTFGPEHVSTAELMKQQLVRDPNQGKNDADRRDIPSHKKPIPEDMITVISNIQDTNEQLEKLAELKKDHPDLLRNPLYVLMNFHQKRVEILLVENQLPGETRPAENIFMDHFTQKYQHLREVNPREYTVVLARHINQLKRFTPLKVKLIESVMVPITAYAPRKVLDILRKIRGGTTITDAHNLTSGSKHLEQARKAIREGKLKPGDIT